MCTLSLVCSEVKASADQPGVVGHKFEMAPVRYIYIYVYSLMEASLEAL